MQGHYTMDIRAEHEYPRIDIHVFIDMSSIIHAINKHLDIR